MTDGAFTIGGPAGKTSDEMEDRGSSLAIVTGFTAIPSLVEVGGGLGRGFVLAPVAAPWSSVVEVEGGGGGAGASEGGSDVGGGGGGGGREAREILVGADSNSLPMDSFDLLTIAKSDDGSC